MPIKWTSNEIQTFLELYQKYEILWNTKSKEYRARISRERAWEDLFIKIRSCGLFCDDIMDLKNRLRIIKTVYMQEVRKIANSVSNDLDIVYKPRLVWFDKADSFLKDVSELRMGSKKGKTCIRTEMTISPQDIPKQYKKKPTMNRKDKSPSPVFNEKSNDEQIYQSIISNGTHCRSPLENKARDETEIFVRRLERKLNAEDQFDLIGKSVAMKLRTLPTEIQIYTEKFINDVLFQAKIGNIDKTTTLHISSSTKCEDDDERYSSNS